MDFSNGFMMEGKEPSLRVKSRKRVKAGC